MGTTYRVVVCGSSLYIAAIAESLRGQTGVRVTQVDPHHPEALARVAALVPHVVIIESVNRSSELVLEMIHRDFPLMGVDTHCGTVEIISRRCIPATNITDLLQAIEEVTREREARMVPAGA